VLALEVCRYAFGKSNIKSWALQQSNNGVWVNKLEEQAESEEKKDEES
jgi:hypothetical protein